MKRVRLLLRQLDELDGPQPDEVDRLRARLSARLAARQVSATLLSELPPPSAGEVARLRARVRARSGWASRAEKPGLASIIRWVPVAAAAGLLASLAPAPVPSVAGHEVLEGAAQLAPIDVVSLRYGGSGEVRWEKRIVDIHWEVGELQSEVTPDEGVDLRVHTREGVVKVVGTEFTVLRDAGGTHVSVQRGVVEVDCEDGADARLQVGEEHTCSPVSAGQWSLNVGRMIEAGAPQEQIIASIERGLRYTAPGDPARGELLVRKVKVYLDNGNTPAAADVARMYLAEGHTVYAEQLRPIAEMVPR